MAILPVPSDWVAQQATTKGGYTKATLFGLGETWPPKKGQVQPVTQFIASPENRDDRTTEAVRAKAAGTNRTYPNVAERNPMRHL